MRGGGLGSVSRASARFGAGEARSAGSEMPHRVSRQTDVGEMLEYLGAAAVKRGKGQDLGPVEKDEAPISPKRHGVQLDGGVEDGPGGLARCVRVEARRS